MKLDEILKSGVSRFGVVKVRNALNPLIWVSPVFAAVAWTAAYFFGSDPFARYTLLALGSAPMIGLLIAYFIFLFRDPNRLQSEEYLLQHEAMQTIWRRGSDQPLEVDQREITTQSEALKRIGKDEQS